MSITVQCPSCGKVLQIPEKYAGQSGRCNKCGATIAVPPVLEAMPPPLSQQGQYQPPPLDALSLPSAQTQQDLRKTKKAGIRNKIGLFLLLILALTGGGAYYYFKEFGSGLFADDISDTSVVYVFRDFIVEDLNEIPEEFKVITLGDVLEQAFRPPFIWETVELSSNDVFANTHRSFIFTAKTKDSLPIRINFLKERQGGIVIVRDVQHADRVIDADELRFDLYAKAMTMAGQSMAESVKNKSLKFSAGLEVGKPYTMKRGLFAGYTSADYSEIFKIRTSKEVKDSWASAMEYIEGGKGILIQEGMQVVLVEEFPDEENPRIGLVQVQGDGKSFFINKQWLSLAAE